jgi:1-acyl-sn-glycerol-3-phosphate acyltransferase
MLFHILYEMTRGVVRAYSRLLLRLDVHWHERPPDGPKLYVANHPSATDPFIIHLLSRQPMSVLITANAFSFPIFGFYIRKVGQIPVIPGHGEQALEQARAYLEAGRSVAIFPEGTFSPQEGGFHEPRTGAARLALSTGVPVIPVGIYLPREKSLRIASKLSGRPTVGYWYLRGPYGITVGKPIRFEGNPADKEHVQSISQNMMNWIRSLADESERRLRRMIPAAASI